MAFSRASLAMAPLSSLLCISAVLLASLPGAAKAQVYTFETHGKEIDRASKILPLPESGEFGDGTDYSSGVTTFRKTLVEIPGNNDLRVAADYIVRWNDAAGVVPHYALQRDWPFIEGTHSFDYGWVAGYAPTDYNRNRCSDSRALSSGGAATIRILKPLDNIGPADYWDGNTLYTKDAGGGIVRPITTGESRPSGVDVKWATNDGWRFSCYTLPDGSEGFIGHRPNGEKYYFGIPLAMGQYSQILSPAQPDVDGWLDVDKYRMYLTRVEDRFGNWVEYSANQINSSDGRIITFAAAPSLGTAGTVIETGGRQWTISGASYLAAPGAFSVTNPDASVWSFAVQSGSIGWTFSQWSNTCSAASMIPQTYSGQMTIAVTTESGAVGTFVLQPRRQGFSFVHFQCDYVLSGRKEGNNYSMTMHFLDTISLVSRTVSGPGIQTYSHVIDYGPLNACYATGPVPAPPDPCTAGSPTTRTVTITASNGTFRTLTYGNKYFDNAGLLLGESNSGLRSASFEQVSLYESLAPVGKRMVVYDVGAVRVFRVRKDSVLQQGRTFVREVPSTCGAGGASLCFDSYFRPTRVVRYSAPSP